MGRIRKQSQKLKIWKLPRKVVRQSGGYYPTEKTCQISNIGTILEMFLGARNNGVFVEVGANDGINCSNTWGLSVRGWRGLMVEPIPIFAEKCRSNYRLNQSISIHQIAIAGRNEEKTSFKLAGMLTSANDDLHSEYKNVSWSKNLLTPESIQVPSTTLDRFLEDNGVDSDFDLLVVDVEGYEGKVFSGFTLEEWHPKMMIVELADTHPDLNSTRKSDAMLGFAIQAKGYTIVYKDWINTVFVRQDVWKSTFEYSDEK
jgi:FkbM family methyltransferase